jgi:hypothetical protein
VDYTVGNGPYEVVAADLNHDGRPDIAVANTCGNNSTCKQGSVSVLLNNGDGTFATQVQYPVAAFAGPIAVGDFNGDGSPDLVVTSTMNGTQGRVSVLLNQGSGSFSPAVSYAAGMSPSGVTVGDFNRDGKLDLAVANATLVGSFSIFLGNGDGTFQPYINSPTGGSGSLSIATADLNGDGILDLAIGSTSVVSILLGKGDGTFQSPQMFSAASGVSLVLADLNHDGKLDLALSGTATFEVLLGNGTGAFKSPLQFLAAGGRQIAAADVNGDGKLDIVATDSSTTDNFVTVYLGN